MHMISLDHVLVSALPGLCHNLLYLKVKLLSCVRLFFDPMDEIAYQAPLSMGFSRQEYWGGLPFSSPGDLPDPGIEPSVSGIAGRLFTA